EKLTRAGKIITLGFGDRVAIGIFLGLLEEISADEAYRYIKSGTSRIDELSEEDWENFRHHAQDLNLKVPGAEQILDVLKQDRLDLTSIIINTPNGKEWLESELDKAKEKLGV
ncbi:unnamed protein product, partial [marine sediment metagenome]